LGASEASLFCQKSRRITYYYLVMTNSSPWYRWPIEIDGLPINGGSFPAELLVITKW
jgi:hypothetical protein